MTRARTNLALDTALDHVAECHRLLTDARNAMAFTPQPGDLDAIGAALLTLSKAVGDAAIVLASLTKGQP